MPAALPARMKLSLTILLAIGLLVGCVVPPQQAATPARPRAERRITFNDTALDAAGWNVLESLESYGGAQLPDGAYWYDPVSGAAGPWGGPAGVLLIPGLPLGGAMPAGASGGGDGSLTGVFINGRELHPLDVAALQSVVGQVYPGRWWLDGQGWFGAEGGAALGNVFQLAQQRGGGGGAGGGRAWSHRLDDGFSAGGDGNGYLYAGGGSTGCSYANDGGGVIC